ncbi:MAG TPA: hypothetical protein VJI13_00220 [Candidatus Norongarragalinales archaeon]|nr:hypothetical protein [Candidatus Norongarragalinales archaeon]
MTVIHHHPDPIQVVSICFALLLMLNMSYAKGLSASETVLTFFNHPWPILAFGMVMIAPAVFFKYFPGSIAFFVSGLILFLVLKAGLN